MKKALAVSLDKELIDWINSKANSKGFRNRSHLVEEAINKFKNEITGENKALAENEEEADEE